jgi:hypothetical protein
MHQAFQFIAHEARPASAEQQMSLFARTSVFSASLIKPLETNIHKNVFTAADVIDLED